MEERQSKAAAGGHQSEGGYEALTAVVDVQSIPPQTPTGSLLTG